MIQRALAWITGAKSAIITGCAVAALCLPTAYCAGYKAANDKHAAIVALVEVESQKKQRLADEQVLKARILADAAIKAARMEVDNALANIPDSTPTARQHARACVQLHRQNATADELKSARCAIPAP